MNILKWLNSKLILLFMMMLVPLLVACEVPLSALVHETVEAGALGYRRKAGQSSNDFSRSRPQETPYVVT